MGIAIVAVLAGHFMQLSGCKGLLHDILNIVSLFVFTEGFLFLSGYGLYFSYRKNSDLGSFYKRRLLRLMIPYIVMCFVYFGIFDLWAADGGGFRSYIGHITSLAFWVEGNFCGMWYIAVSLLLYALFPVIFKLVFVNDKLYWPGLITVMFVMWLTNAILQSATPEYYSKVRIGLNQMPCFVIGMVAGYFTQKKKIGVNSILWILICLVCLTGLSWYITNVVQQKIIFDTVPLKLTTLMISVLLLAILDSAKKGGRIYRILDWLGQYTLEIYIIHLLLYNSIMHIIDNKMVAAIMMVAGALLLCVPFKYLENKIINNLS